MSGKGSSIAGLELLYNIVRDSVTSRHDLVVAAVHNLLLTEGLRLVRVGDELSNDADASSRTTELLPAGWNGSQDVYTLQYIRNTDGQTDKYLLKAVKIDEALHVSLLRFRDEKTASVSLDPASYTAEDWSTFDSAYQNMDSLVSLVTDELLLPFRRNSQEKFAAARSSPGSQTQQPAPERSRLPAGAAHPGPARYWPPPMVDPFAVGRGDLDPLGGGIGAGGMYMDPMRQGRGPWPPLAGGGAIGQPPGSEFVPGGLPRGAVPPGARYDPFGPPLPSSLRDTRPRPPERGPDNDHMRPPGFDDMFM